MTVVSPVSEFARNGAAAVLVALVIAGCATPPPGTGAATATPGALPQASGAAAPSSGPVPSATTAAATAPSSAPASADPAVARSQAAKLALEAVDQLQNGDEAGARATLERALALDAVNELARKLQDQIRADAQKELGAVYFRYTVQRDDTLSRLAQQYLGDRYRFYILAKYNEIANPSRLAAGQVIRIPGRQPTVAIAPETPVKPPEPEIKPPSPPPPPSDSGVEALAKGADLEKSGNLEAAYALYVDAAQRNPGNGELAKRRDAVKARLLSGYDREATQAFQRQNLDLAIAKWDRILEIDPQNRKARLERERAQDLKRRLAQKFSK